MKTKLRLLFLMIAVNLILIGLVLLLSQNTARETVSQAVTTVYEVTNISASNIFAVKVENELASYAVMQNGPALEMVSMNSGEWDESQLRAFVYAAGHISGSRKVADETKFSDYGLDNPRSNITIFMADGSEKVYRVLANNPLDRSTYFYSQDDQAVYLVARDVADLFLRSEKDFLSHTIFRVKSEADYPSVEKIEIRLMGKGRDYTVEKTDRGYYLTSPVFIRLPQERVMNDLLGSILRLYADEIIEMGAQPAAYGLDQPDMALSVTGNKQTQSAVFRLEQNNESLMAQPEGSVIYRLGADPVLMLMQDYTTLLGSSLISYKPAELSDLTISTGEQRLFIEFTGTGDNLAIQIDGKKLSEEEAAVVLKAINSISPVGEVSGTSASLPQLSMKAYFKNGIREMVDFILLEEDRFAVSIDGKTAFATDGQAVRALRDIVEKFAPAQKEGL